MPNTEIDHEIAHEQRVLDRLYGRLDELRAQAARRLHETRRQRVGGNVQNQSERDAFAAMYEDRVAQLAAVENRLAFGRLDLHDGETRYIGRIGLADDDQRQLLVDWRAKAAEVFYRATAADPQGVVRRRHLATRERRVTALEDELLDLDAATQGPDALHLTGEGALMAALAEHRTGRMRDIVSTIQAEQDRIIRAPMAGVLVVQGGPGTGKTAVALHRAAYLLYTHRERARSGVLVVGPSPVFLRYIEQVLPSLGETGVVMATPGQLLPGVDASEHDGPRAARLKGDLRMARVIARAVAARQRIPAEEIPLDVDGTRVWLRPEAVRAARSRARRTGKPHNVARERFVTEVLRDLAAQLAAARHRDFDEGDLPALEADLRESRDVRREVNLCWMPITPQRLLAELWADRTALARAAPYLSSGDLAALHRERSAPWTVSDVPLLDEAAELLGEDETANRLEQRRRAAEQATGLAYAQEVLATTGAGGGLVTAEQLAERFADTGPQLTVAERAAADRTWVFSHVVVDEAQELSPMTWRVLVRRCPSRSMTVVGDLAQTASTAGAASWAAALDRYAAGRWRLEELTVNYRTPAPVMELAAGVLAAHGVPVRPPRSARDGKPPRAVRVGRPSVAALADAVAETVRAELGHVDGGKVAVVTARRGYERLSAALTRPLGHEVVGVGPAALDAPVAVLDVEEVKGLEFDAVVLVEPAAVLEQSERGANDLYVALTRPTQRLAVVHARELPAGLDVLNS